MIQIFDWEAHVVGRIWKFIDQIHLSEYVYMNHGPRPPCSQQQRTAELDWGYRNILRNWTEPGWHALCGWGRQKAQWGSLTRLLEVLVLVIRPRSGWALGLDTLKGLDIVELMRIQHCSACQGKLFPARMPERWLRLVVKPQISGGPLLISFLLWSCSSVLQVYICFVELLKLFSLLE